MTMKKLSSILMLAMIMLAALSFTSCGDDDNGGSSIVGVWTCTSYPFDNTGVGNIILTFNKDYTYSIHDKSDSPNESGKYIVSGNTLSLTDSGGQTIIEFDIITLSFTTLTIREERGGQVFSFSRQSDSGDSGSGAQFVINGKAYNLSSNQFGVAWNEPPFGSVIQICTGPYGKTDPDEIYTFGFLACKNDTYCEPTVGLDVSKLEYSYASLTLKFGLTIRDTKAKTNTEYEYVSGSLIIVDINKSKETITLKFNDLKMRSGGDSYMFNGTITLPLHIS